MHSSTDIRRRELIKGAGSITMGGIISGCTSANSGDQTGEEDGLSKVKVTMSHFGLWDTSIPFLVGTEKGFFKEEGLKVSKISASGGGSTVRTVVSGDAHLGFATGTFSVLGAISEGADIKILSNEWSSASDLFWYAKADSEYDSPGELDGAKIGFSRAGSSTDMVAKQVVKNNNLENAETVSVGGPPDSFTAVKTDEIDIGWSVPPYFLKEVKDGVTKRIFTGDEVPPFNNLSLRVNYGNHSWLSSNRKIAESYFRAHNKARNWAYSNLDESVKIWKDVVDYEEDILKDSVEAGYPKDNGQLNNFTNMEEVNKLAVEHGFIDEKLSKDELDNIIDASYLS